LRPNESAAGLPAAPLPLGETPPRHSDALGVPEPGKDAFHRVPFIPAKVRDAVERVLTVLEDRFMGRAGSILGDFVMRSVQYNHG
jgi:hypothetical protein